MSFRSVGRIRILLSGSLFFSGLLTLLLFSPAASGSTTLYWDATSGSLKGAGTWDTTTANWSTVSTGGGTHVAWTPNDGTLDASFAGALTTPPPQDGTGSVD